MDKIPHDKARELIEKYLKGSCTEQEKALVEQWYTTIGDEHIKSLREEDAVEDVLELQDRLAQIIPIPKRKLQWKRLAVAAVFACCVAGAALIWKNQRETRIIEESRILAEGILPASRKASLTLDDDPTITLDDNQGIVTQGSAITYEDGTAIQTTDRVRTATLRTPAGGYYYAILPDGTEVWLNAESSIQYPTSFANDNRTVTVTGEVFMQVAKMPEKPFRIQMEYQQIEVLGTGFNINAYADNGRYETTLVEGSLRVTDNNSDESVVIKPGEQVLVSPNSKLMVKAVDTEEFTSWKEGVYLINNQSLEWIGKRLERWYDIDVDMGKHRNRQLSVIVRNDVKLSEMLHAIQLKTGVKFLIEGRRVRAVD